MRVVVNSSPTGTDRPIERPVPSAPVARLRIGVLGGLVGIGCCLGPTVLAAIGVISGATASTWGNHLYDSYAWWFRAAGLATMTVLIARALHRSGQCSVHGVRSTRRRLVLIAVVAAATYAAVYGLTSWLERFA